MEREFPCEHTDHYIKVLNVTATCEVTVRACVECDEELDEPETNC